MKDHKKPVETFGASAFSNHQTEYYGENGGYDNCSKRNDSSRKAGAIREALTSKMWQEKEANELEM